MNWSLEKFRNPPHLGLGKIPKRDNEKEIIAEVEEVPEVAPCSAEMHDEFQANPGQRTKFWVVTPVGLPSCKLRWMF